MGLVELRMGVGSAVEKAGLNGLNEGQVVEYEEIPNKGKTSAGHLKLQR